MRLIVTILVLLLVPFAAWATEIDRLISGLSSGNEASMVEARQMLPRQSVEAVPKLIALVDHEDRRIAFAAHRILEDFIGVVTRPGREDDQRFVTRQVLQLLSREATEQARDVGFRLVPLVAPEDFDELGPVAMWLINPEARESARASLALTGTLPARNALRAALESADAAFQVALLDALAQFDDPLSVAPASRLLEAAEPEVRTAATRVLARSGGVNEISPIRLAMQQLEDEHHREAAESYAVLAERILLSGGNWDAGIGIFVEILENSRNSVAKGIALAGVGRFGDERAVPVILAALESDGGEALVPQAIAAFQHLDGSGVREALLAAHDSLPASMQVRMLDVYARKHDERFLELIVAGAQAEERDSQRMALSALSASRFPEVVDALVTLAGSTDLDFRYEVLRSLEKTAANMESQGVTDAAGRAYLAVYQKSDMPVVRQMALKGIMRCPVPEAHEVLLAEIDTGDVGDLPVDLLAGLTRALFDDGRTEEAQSTLTALLARATAPHEVNALVETLHGVDGVGDLRNRLGILTNWKVVGPFDWAMDDAFTVINIDEPNIDPDASYTGKTGEEIAWTEVQTPSPHGFVELTGVLGQHEHCSAYGFTTITVVGVDKGHILVGSDDGIKVWVNGEAVLERNVDRGMALDQDSAPITLRDGENQILVQVTQNAAGWGFVVRLTNEQGVPLQVVRE